MQVLQVPFTYYPDTTGGTEVYVKALTQHLRAAGIDGAVAAPGDETRTYSHEDSPVYRFETSPTAGPRDVYGAGDEHAAAQFASILCDLDPDIVHLHARTRAVSLRLVEAAQAQEIPVLYTYHTPTGSCLRGSLMRRGTSACDGELKVGRCTSCVLQEHGLPDPLSTLLGSLPPRVGQILGKMGRAGGGWTALRMSELVTLHHEATRDFWEAVDHIVSVCEWACEVLLRNEVPEEKITVSRQGLPLSKLEHGETEKTPSVPHTFDAERPLQLAFFGRLHPIKGPAMVVRALRQIPKVPVALDIYGIAQDSPEYVDELRTQVRKDSRVALRDPVASEKVPSAMQDYDAIVVPSKWFETGPLVVYEAFAAGRPVVGSDLGGIAELVTDGVDGVLVEADSEAAWGRAIKRLANDPSLLTQLSSGIQRPRTMKDAAADMADLYRRILSGEERSAR